MKRITKKNRRVGTGKGVSQHLFWNSFWHMRDKEKADELRESNRTLIVLDKKGSGGREEFPHAMEICGNYRVEKRPEAKNRFIIEEKDKDSWVQFHQQMSRSRSYYLRKGKKKKDGTYGEKRCKTKGVIDTYVTVPKWWTRAIAEEVRAGRLDAKEVKLRMRDIAGRLILKHEKRTGYEGLYAAVHPDSTENLQIHLGVGTVDPKTHQLLGRSAGGTRGRRGLKELGDCFLYIWNLSHLGKLPESCLKLPKLCFKEAGGPWDKGNVQDDYHPFDDVALTCCLEPKLQEYFPECFDRAMELGQEMALGFSSTVEKKMETKESLRNQISYLKQERKTLKLELSRMRGPVK